MIFKCKLSWFLCIAALYNAKVTTSASLESDLKLELVQVLFRHGERTPIDCETKFYPNTSESLYEPWGYDQLTNIGMMQEYEIGRMLRNRYNHFLPDLYRSKDVYAFSSDYDRTKASLQLVLAGLYPPVESLTWNKDLKWMPIAVHFNPLPMDILMKPRDCPNFTKNVRELYNSTEIRAKLAEYKDVLETLSEIRGEDFEVDQVNCAYNIIHIHKHLNLSLPSWYNDELYSRIVSLTEFFLDTLAYNNALKRLNAGPLIRRMTEHLNNTHSKKLYLYSGHEKNLHPFDRAHGFNVLTIPEHGSAFVVEKSRDNSGNAFVKILLWSGTPKKLRAIKLKSCAENCPIGDYMKILKPVLPSDDDMRCLYNNLKAEDIEKILISDITRK